MPIRYFARTFKFIEGVFHDGLFILHNRSFMVCIEEAERTRPQLMKCNNIYFIGSEEESIEVTELLMLHRPEYKIVCENKEPHLLDPVPLNQSRGVVIYGLPEEELRERSWAFNVMYGE